MEYTCRLYSFGSSRGQWVDYRCRLGSSGNSSTASGSSIAPELVEGEVFLIFRLFKYFLFFVN